MTTSKTRILLTFLGVAFVGVLTVINGYQSGSYLFFVAMIIVIATGFINELPRWLQTIIRLLIALALAVAFGYALVLALVAVVCTAGIGLIVVIPVMAVLILMLVNSWRAVFGKPAISWRSANKKRKTGESSAPAPQAQTAVRPEVQAIAKYIVSARQYGMPDGEITTTLVSRGWTDEVVKLGFAVVPPMTPAAA